jgi:hypothetical protein
MKTNQLKLTLAAVLLLTSLKAVHAQFTTGDLAVLQVGTGPGSLSSASTALFIDEFSPTVQNDQVQQIVIPATGTGLTLSGTATSEGELALSTDGSMLNFGGYAAASGVSGIASGTATREIGVINGNGQFSIVANSTTNMQGNNIRGVVSDGQNYWISAPGGVFYQAQGSTTPVKIGTGNARVVNIFNGNLGYSTSSGTPHGLFQFSGTPSSTATATSLFGSPANASSLSSYDFAINSAGTIAYVADDGTIDGIQKWELISGTWTLDYTLGVGTTSGARQLTVNWSGSNPILYATTGETSANRLVEITDIGAASAFTTLDTAAANTVFRGVDFTPQPVPEPSACALIGMGLAGLWGFQRRNRKSC